MHPTLKLEISALHAQIKEHRVATKRIRETLRELRARPFATRDPMTAYRAMCALHERLRLIRDCQQAIRERK